MCAIAAWIVSSAGRAPPLQGGGHWFEPSTIHQYSTQRYSHGLLAQLGEHHPYKAGVTGSNPVQSTKLLKSLRAPPALYEETVVTGSNPVQSTKFLINNFNFFIQTISYILITRSEHPAAKRAVQLCRGTPYIHPCRLLFRIHAKDVPGQSVLCIYRLV